MKGTPGYTGAIYVIGAGAVERKGGGNGQINCGGMLITNTVVLDSQNSAGDWGRFSRPLKRVTFQQLR